ncbi:MAG: hypothetical protein LBH50_06740 [Spirochaetaceae bacterium]|jgi:hypothetical protein|nr:hypothetical protein [Spirochaetaceae bacterium]
MKRLILMVGIALFYTTLNFAEEFSGEYKGKAVENLVSAVRTAKPGDYILLPSGKKYVLTKEEIAIAKGEFDYEDLSEVATKVEQDGTGSKTISQAHTAYVYPDGGQATRILKTSISLTAFLRHIQETYFLAQYIDLAGSAHGYINIDPPDFSVFRANVQHETVSDGIEEMQSLSITVYNYDGENIHMKYCSKPNMIWGSVSEKGAYKPVGKFRRIEFDVE